jgi:hypothetical protein
MAPRHTNAQLLKSLSTHECFVIPGSNKVAAKPPSTFNPIAAGRGRVVANGVLLKIAFRDKVVSTAREVLNAQQF